MTSWTEIMTSSSLFQNIFILRRPRETFFAEIIKIVAIFIKTIFKDTRKVKTTTSYVSKCNLYLYFLIWQNLLICGKKMLMSAELKRCVTWFIYFLDFLYVMYNCAKFHHCRICVTDFREGTFLPHLRPHPWVAPKRPILNRVNKSIKIGKPERMIFLVIIFTKILYFTLKVLYIKHHTHK